MLIEYNELSYKALEQMLPYKVSELLLQAKNSFTGEDLQKLKEMNYKGHPRYGINFSIGLESLLKNAEEKFAPGLKMS